MTLFGVVVAGVAGQPRRLLDRLRGRLLRAPRAAREEPVHPHQPPSTSTWADSWFERHGDATVFFSRMLPIIRTFISLPAGVARMPFWRFTVLTLLGCIPWVLALALIGSEVGDNWDGLARPPPLPRLRRRSPRSCRGHLPDRPPAPHPAAGVEAWPRPPTRPASASRARRPSGRSRARPSCCPVSSSAHLSLVPRLAGWGWDEIDPEARKSFEVALHAGTAAALLVGQRREIAAELAAFDARRAAVVGALVRAARGRRLRARAPDRGAPRRPARRSPPGSSPGRRRCWPPTRRPQERGPGDAGAASTGSRSASPRPPP